ncbi:hypothetical protein GW17_00037218 [Ensete ventricosum]|nr:hypothetical protein GW17_00037218 [Ensete ventricosum]
MGGQACCYCKCWWKFWRRKISVPSSSGWSFSRSSFHQQTRTVCPGIPASIKI